MKNEQGNSINVHSIASDYLGWGAFRNNISWMADGLQDNVKYEVTLSNVIIDGNARTYTYWFKLTDEDNGLPVPAAPNLIAPVNYIANIDASAPVTFSWYETNYAVKYKLEISLTEGFTSIFTEKETNNTFVEVASLTPNTTFYWRVIAYNEEDETSPYSEVRNFTTIPDAPELTYPAANANNISSITEFTWSKVDVAAYYQLQVATSEDFADDKIVIDQSGIADTTYKLTATQELEENTTYYWRVRAFLPLGNSTLWTAARTFKTIDTHIDENFTYLTGITISSYPNPFSESTNISIYATKEQFVTLDIINSYGIIVNNLFTGFVSTGENSFKFKPSSLEAEIYSGAYFCRIFVAGKSKILPITFTK